MMRRVVKALSTDKACNYQNKIHREKNVFRACIGCTLTVDELQYVVLLIVRDVSDLKLLTRTTKGRWCFLFPFFILILCTTIFSTRNKLEEVARIVAAENRHTWTTALEIEQWISINRERKQIHSAGMRAFLTTS